MTWNGNSAINQSKGWIYHWSELPSQIKVIFWAGLRRSDDYEDMKITKEEGCKGNALDGTATPYVGCPPAAETDLLTTQHTSTS